MLAMRAPGVVGGCVRRHGGALDVMRTVGLRGDAADTGDALVGAAALPVLAANNVMAVVMAALPSAAGRV